MMYCLKKKQKKTKKKKQKKKPKKNKSILEFIYPRELERELVLWY